MDTKNIKNKKNTIKKIVIALAWLIIWQIVSVIVDNRFLLVGPIEVIGAFFRDVVQIDFWAAVLNSLVRIGGGFIAGLLMGIFLAILAYVYPFAEEIMAPIIGVIKTVPVVSFVVLLLIWAGSDRLAFFIVALIVFPNIFIGCLSGLKMTDKKLLLMADCFGFGRIKKAVYIYRDAVKGQLSSAMKASLGLAWKSGIAAEVIGLPKASLGEKIYMSKVYIDTADLFAWTLTVLLLSLIFEKIIMCLAGTVFEAGHKTGKTVLTENKLVSKKSVEDKNKTTDAGEKVYRFSDINVSYEGKKILDNVGFEIETGKIYVLMAPSGTGKTTLLNEVIKRCKDNVSVMFQEDRLLMGYSALTNILLGNNLLSYDECVDVSERILPKDSLYMECEKLSGGMKRRTALLRTLLHQAPIMLLDEPFSGLDDENRQKCIELIREYSCDRAVIVVTHDETDIEKLGGEKWKLA